MTTVQLNMQNVTTIPNSPEVEGDAAELKPSSTHEETKVRG